MDLERKVDILAAAAQWDTERGCSKEGRVRGPLNRWIYPAIRPDGKRIRMLKVLQSNVCENNCAYCAFRRDRDVPRTTFRPEELARLFDDLVRRRLVEGLFLSSGIYGDVAKATERMLATVELLRKRYGFRGYIHLKILPGADWASIEESVRLASRVSVNLEAPNQTRLQSLSQEKRFQDLLARLMAADEARKKLGKPVSLTTQFVVGAAGESDSELLGAAARLYREIRLARAYYSAFQPISDTPLESHTPTSPLREHRLYQADFLLRQYGFDFAELVFDDSGNLPAEADPKLMWALRHPGFFPVEVNTASREALLRVPGIGPETATRIITRRRQGRLRTLEALGLRRDLAQCAAPFILLDGRPVTRQGTLWPTLSAVA